jgi:hypothetical protein
VVNQLLELQHRTRRGAHSRLPSLSRPVLSIAASVCEFFLLPGSD